MSDRTRILVTGGTGFVGSSIIAAIQNTDKFELYSLSRNKTEIINGKQIDYGTGKIIQCDISDDISLRKLENLENLGVLIHTAGLAHQFGKVSKDDFWRTNVQGTENICRLAGKLQVRHLILISSVSVYGDYGELEIDEDFTCNPVGLYAESKLEAEKKALELCQKNGIGLTILRLGTVIGEGDIGNVSRLITLIDKNRFFWVGNGSNKKSLIYKNDIADCVLRLLEIEQINKAEIYNLTSVAIPMKEIVSIISVSLKKKPIPIRLPKQIPRILFQLNNRTLSLEVFNKIENTFKKWLSNDKFSGRKLYESYGFEPQTSISEAIKRQVNSYIEKKNN